jgi:hypothetical protein
MILGSRLRGRSRVEPDYCMMHVGHHPSDHSIRMHRLLAFSTGENNGDRDCNYRVTAQMITRRRPQCASSLCLRKSISGLLRLENHRPGNARLMHTSRRDG